MTFRTFRRLHRLLEHDLKKARGGSNRDNPDYVERSSNGSIPLTVRLACALCFFEGGEAYDISVMFSISHSSVFESIDYAINAVNQCGKMEIKFPSSHDEQQRNIGILFEVAPRRHLLLCWYSLKKNNAGWIDDWILQQIIPEGLPFSLRIEAVRGPFKSRL